MPDLAPLLRALDTAVRGASRTEVKSVGPNKRHAKGSGAIRDAAWEAFRADAAATADAIVGFGWDEQQIWLFLYCADLPEGVGSRVLHGLHRPGEDSEGQRFLARRARAAGVTLERPVLDERPLPSRLPLTEDELPGFLDALGIGPDDGVPCWGPDGEWVGLSRIEADGLFNLTPGGDPGAHYVRGFDEAEAREALRNGAFHLALIGSEIGEVEDGGGNVYLTIHGTRTTHGTEPVYYLGHGEQYAKPRANSVVEFYARWILDHWGDIRMRQSEICSLLDTPVELEPACLEAAQARIDQKLWEDGED